MTFDEYFRKKLRENPQLTDDDRALMLETWEFALSEAIKIIDKRSKAPTIVETPADRQRRYSRDSHRRKRGIPLSAPVKQTRPRIS